MFSVNQDLTGDQKNIEQVAGKIQNYIINREFLSVLFRPNLAFSWGDHMGQIYKVEVLMNDSFGGPSAFGFLGKLSAINIIAGRR
jgi:hypothetical protein